jgi:lactoylglutathione lyase
MRLLTTGLALASVLLAQDEVNLFDPDGTRVELMEPNTIDGKPAPSSTAPPPVHTRTP